MSHPLWILLAMLHGSKWALSDWRRLLENRFDAVRRFLVKCPGEIAGSIPSPDGALRLDVFPRGAGYEALPQEHCESAIEPMEGLTEADVILWRLDWQLFENTLSRALGLKPVECPTHAGARHSLLGTVGQGTARRRVYLGYAWNEPGGLELCLAVARDCADPCVMALPAFFPACDEYLRQSSRGYLVLEESVSLGASGMVCRPDQMPKAWFFASASVKGPDPGGQSTGNAPQQSEVRRVRIARRNGRAGGRPTTDSEKLIMAAVQDVLDRLRNNPYLKVKRACELAVEEGSLTIGWQALRRHVKKVQRRSTDKKSRRDNN